MNLIELIAMVVSWVMGLGNLIALVVIYRRYLALAQDSVAFASEVIGHLSAADETGEVEDPMGLIATSLDQMGKLSGFIRY